MSMQSALSYCLALQISLLCSHVALWSAAEVLTAQSSEHSFHSELSDLMSARQEWHATLDDVLEGTHDDLEAIMISARYCANFSSVVTVICMPCSGILPADTA